MHCSKAINPQHSAKDYCNGRNTANEEVTGSQQCLQEDRELGVHLGTQAALFWLKTFWTSVSSSHRLVLEAGNGQTCCRKFQSLGVVSPSASCQVVAAQLMFFLYSCRAFLYSYTSLISVSNKRGKYNKIKRWHTFDIIIAYNRTPWNIHKWNIHKRKNTQMWLKGVYAHWGPANRRADWSAHGRAQPGFQISHNVLVQVCLAVVGWCKGAQPGYGEWMAKYHLQIHPFWLFGPSSLLLL